MENPKKEIEKEVDKENKEGQIINENQIFEKELKTLPEIKLIQFTKNSYNIRLKLYSKQIKDLEESYNEIDKDFHSILDESYAPFHHVRDYLIFFNFTIIIFNWYKQPSNEVRVLINNIIKSFSIDNFENIPEKPKKYHKELIKYYEARLNDALEKYRKNKDSKSLFGKTCGSNGENCVISWSREEILRKLLKFKIDVRYVRDYQRDINFNDKISNIKSQIKQLTKKNTMHLEERIDLIEKLDDNINTLIEFMTNFKEAFKDCFFDWNGYFYSYKDKPYDDNDLFGLKRTIKDFMYNDKMGEVLTFDKTLSFDNIDFP